MMSARQLEQQHLKAGCLSQVQIDWLRRQGVSETAIIADWPVNAANVVFDGNRFDIVAPAAGGQKAVTILIEDTHQALDIGAWAPSTGQTGLWLGTGFAANQSDIWNPAKTAFNGCLKVHATPLEWLKADRDGIVIFDFAKCYAYLRNVRAAFICRHWH